MKRLLTTIAMLAFICCMAAQLPPKREFRGVWMPTVTGEYTGLSEKEMKSKLIGQLDRMQELGINAVLFQVRPEADAWYRSAMEPLHHRPARTGPGMGPDRIHD